MTLYIQIGNNNLVLPYEESLYLEYYMKLKLYNLSFIPFIFSSIAGGILIFKIRRVAQSQSLKMFLFTNHRRQTMNILQSMKILTLVLNGFALTVSACLFGYQCVNGFKAKFMIGFDFERSLKLKYLEEIKLYRDLKL